MISEEEKESAWHSLYNELSNRSLGGELSQTQLDYLMERILKSARPGDSGTKTRTRLRQLKLGSAVRIARVKEPSKPYETIYEELAQHYSTPSVGVSKSQIKKAHLTTKDDFAVIDEAYPDIKTEMANEELPHINFENFTKK